MKSHPKLLFPHMPLGILRSKRTKRAYFIVKVNCFAFSRNNSGDRYAEALSVFGVTGGDWVPRPNVSRTAQFCDKSPLIR